MPRPTLTLGKYGCVEPIAMGPLGEIWRAKQYGAAGLERQVAIHRVAGELSADPTFADRLNAAARSYAALLGSGIPRLLSVGESGPWRYLVFDHVRAGSLLGFGAAYRRCAADKAAELLPDTVAVLGQSIAAVLMHAHERGVLHLGLCPRNVLLCPSGQPFVLELGLLAARLPGGPSGALDPEGALPFMAPEVLDGDRPDQRSDVFSLCAILYECLFGTPPFSGETRSALRQAMHRPLSPPLVEPRAADFDNVYQVVRRGLLPQPRDRYPSMPEMIRALEAWPRPHVEQARALLPRIGAELLRGTRPEPSATAPSPSGVEPLPPPPGQQTDRGGSQPLSVVVSEKSRDSLRDVVLSTTHVVSRSSVPQMAAPVTIDPRGISGVVVAVDEEEHTVPVPHSPKSRIRTIEAEPPLPLPARREEMEETPVRPLPEGVTSREITAVPGIPSDHPALRVDGAPSSGEVPLALVPHAGSQPVVALPEPPPAPPPASPRKVLRARVFPGQKGGSLTRSGERRAVTERMEEEREARSGPLIVESEEAQKGERSRYPDFEEPTALADYEGSSDLKELLGMTAAREGSAEAAPITGREPTLLAMAPSGPTRSPAARAGQGGAGEPELSPQVSDSTVTPAAADVIAELYAPLITGPTPRADPEDVAPERLFEDAHCSDPTAPAAQAEGQPAPAAQPSAESAPSEGADGQDDAGSSLRDALAFGRQSMRPEGAPPLSGVSTAPAPVIAVPTPIEPPIEVQTAPASVLMEPARRRQPALLWFTAGALGLFMVLGAVSMFMNRRARPTVSPPAPPAQARREPSAPAPAPKEPKKKEAPAPPAQPGKPPETEASFRVSSTPAAILFVDGKIVGRTPKELTLSGAHDLVLVANGRKIWRGQSTGEPLDIDLEPVALPREVVGPGGVKVRCATRGLLRILVDGNDSGLSCPTDKLGLLPGPHRLEFLNPGTGAVKARKVNVRKGRWTRVEMKL